MAVLVNDLMMSKLTDIRYKLGTAPIAVPVTETERIPDWKEVAQVQTISRKCEEYLPIIESYIDWKKIEGLRDQLVIGGRQFFSNAIKTMKEMQVDVNDPARVLIVMKLLGPEKCEELFGVGERDNNYIRGHKPVLETDLVRQTMEKRKTLLDNVSNLKPDEKLNGKKIVVASTDVHEFAKFLLISTLESVGGRVVDFGINRDPEDIVKVALETEADAIVITTHNGVARSFGMTLMESMNEAGLSSSVFMGGVLNEDIEGSTVPVDVREHLHRMGIATPDSVEDLLGALR
jgi:methylmalonyl-CoA mutase cobalamin-binding subunit